jgi:hypothetical protein
MKISTILDHIDLGHIALPEFQRGYVWNREQVRALMNSLYRGYPIGSLLVWVTQTEGAATKGSGEIAPGIVKLLLDGQQRITSLFGIVRGKAPMFFDGNIQTFTGLHFHLENEIFEFYMPAKMKDDPLWINATELMQGGAAKVFADISVKINMNEKMEVYLGRLNSIAQITDTALHVEEITGQDKTVDVVVEIFNKVNSGGTKLSKGDLALAKICASWSDAREELKKRMEKWSGAGFNFKLEWLLRNINAILTDEALFSALQNVDIDTFKEGLIKAEKMIDNLLNLISSRLGLDHDRVLGGRGAFPLMSSYLGKMENKSVSSTNRDKLLYWYVHSFLWGRYAGSTEATLRQDLTQIQQTEGALDRLIDNLRQNRGNLTITEQDITGWSIGARFYPLIYMLTRVYGSIDWDSGIKLSAHILGKLSSLQVHHIFPKALLYEQGYSQSEVNALANFTFLTQDTNLKIGKKPPEEYFLEIIKNHPGALESHWIPMDRDLWKVDNYKDFLKERRILIANAANDFLNSLYQGKVAETEAITNITERTVPMILGGIADDTEEKIILDCSRWVQEQGLPPGDFQYELCDDSTGETLAILDLAWPEGLQPGYSIPVVLLIDEGKEIENIVNRIGYRFFTSVADLKEYISNEILGLSEEKQTIAV